MSGKGGRIRGERVELGGPVVSVDLAESSGRSKREPPGAADRDARHRRRIGREGNGERRGKRAKRRLSCSHAARQMVVPKFQLGFAILPERLFPRTAQKVLAEQQFPTVGVAAGQRFLGSAVRDRIDAAAIALQGGRILAGEGRELQLNVPPYGDVARETFAARNVRFGRQREDLVAFGVGGAEQRVDRLFPERFSHGLFRSREIGARRDLRFVHADIAGHGRVSLLARPIEARLASNRVHVATPQRFSIHRPSAHVDHARARRLGVTTCDPPALRASARGRRKSRRNPTSGPCR